VLLSRSREVDAELCPNEKMVDESRFFDGESNLSTSRASRTTVQVLEGLEKEARETRKGLWWNRIPCRRGRGGIGNRVSGRLTGWRWRVLRHSQRDTNCRPKYVR